MTFCHIQLRKIDEDKRSIKYAAFSPDFNEEFSDEKMAEIVVDKNKNTYEFFPSLKWIDQKTIPPLFYSFSSERQDELRGTKYKGYGNGAWSMRIHNWISRFIQEGAFPDVFPK